MSSVSIGVSFSLRSHRDVDAAFALDHGEALQPQPLVGGALAALELVFVAVPGTDDMHLALIEALTEQRLVGAEHVLHLRQHYALAGRSALMDAQIAIGEIFSGVAIDPDLG